jgi:DNA-binding NtrC family response regulator
MEIEKTILIIEKDKELMAIYKEILEIYNYDIHTASNGREGIEKFKQTKPSLVIMEVDVYDLNWHNVFKKIKEIEKNTDVVIVTSDLEFEARNREALDQERIKVILKPLLVNELLNLAKKYAKIKLEKILDHTEDAMLELTCRTDKFLKNIKRN